MADEVVVKVSGIEDTIFDGISSSRELRRAVNRFVDDIHDTWQRIWDVNMQGVLAQETGHPHPYQTGDYRAHIKKDKLSLGQRLFIKRAVSQGVPIGLVYNDSDVAHWVEYGTDVDQPGGHSPWGPDTPTPEFSPMTTTAIIMNSKVIS